jgi:type I restriction enzyme M protein
MSADNNEELNSGSEPEDEEPAAEQNYIIDILTGEKLSPSPKNRLVQRVLHQLIESYGFDRNDLRRDYRLTTQGRRQKKVEIAVLKHETEAVDENVERIIVCQPQRRREKLRSPQEASADLRVLQEKMQFFPSCGFGMWTNGQEEFFLKAEDTKFETKFISLGVWPPPGEGTTEAFQEGGVTQITADPEDLESSLRRCFQYLNKNLGLDHKESFRQLAILLIAKLYDETQPHDERKFWISGDDPFTEEGQQRIDLRIRDCLATARYLKPELFRPGWDLQLDEPSQLAPLVAEVGRYSLSETLPRSRALAFRSMVRSTMDGREGRYPTPINVAEMAVNMMSPTLEDRVLDCASGTGTFLAFTVVHIFNQILRKQGTTAEKAAPTVIRDAQQEAAEWVREHLYGCEIDPYLAVASRLNLLFTIGEPGNIFRLDSRTYPDGDLDGLEAAKQAIPDGSMDLVLTNPWFSTAAEHVVRDETILARFDLGKVWNRLDDGTYANLGTLNTAGVPPEVLFLERAWRWAKPGTGHVAVLLPDGLLGNPSDEYIRYWILRHCEVIASIDLPIEPFKVTVKEYQLTPALPSLLVLRRRGEDELLQTTHPDYWVFMAVVEKAGVDPRGNTLYQIRPDGEEIVEEREVIERVRSGEEIEVREVRRLEKPIDDEVPIVAERFGEWVNSGRTGE